jgi:hypothetical protein
LSGAGRLLATVTALLPSPSFGPLLHAAENMEAITMIAIFARCIGRSSLVLGSRIQQFDRLVRKKMPRPQAVLIRVDVDRLFDADRKR